jgi:hypothetical protein
MGAGGAALTGSQLRSPRDCMRPMPSSQSGFNRAPDYSGEETAAISSSTD